MHFRAVWFFFILSEYVSLSVLLSCFSPARVGVNKQPPVAVGLNNNDNVNTLQHEQGSSNLWVDGSDCGDSCGDHAEYDSSASSSYKENGTLFKVEYGSGACTGHLSQDTLSWGGLELKNQTFAEVTNASGFGELYKFSKLERFDGILGLAFDSLAVCDFPYQFGCIETPFHNMIDAGMLDSPVFSFYLGDMGKKPLMGADGELLLGERLLLLPCYLSGCKIRVL